MLDIMCKIEPWYDELMPCTKASSSPRSRANAKMPPCSPGRDAGPQSHPDRNDSRADRYGAKRHEQAEDGEGQPTPLPEQVEDAGRGVPPAKNIIFRIGNHYSGNKPSYTIACTV